MKKILFPTDFSESAEKAFIYAIQMAEKTESSITVLHVYSNIKIIDTSLPMDVISTYNTLDFSDFNNTKDKIDYFENLAKKHQVKTIDIEYKIIEGLVVEELIEESKKEYDLIVMGTNGASGFKEVFLGSTAVEVVDRSSIPVLSIPSQGVFDQTIDEIVYIVDYKKSNPKSLDYLYEFATLFSAKIHFVRADQQHTEEHKHRFEEWYHNLDAKFFRISTSKIIDTVDRESDVSNYCENNNIDVIFMAYEHKGFWANLFHNQFTKGMVYHSKIPVLCINI